MRAIIHGLEASPALVKATPIRVERMRVRRKESPAS